jgi:signal peptidase II
MRPRTKIILFFALAIACIALDRYTKQLAKEYLQFQPDKSYLHDSLRLEYAENTGAMLSLGDNLPKSVSFWVLSMMPLALMVWLLYYFIKHLHQLNGLKTISLSLIFAGGLGNLVDRIFFDRHVTDFINIGILSLRTGIFNVADMCVTGGVIGLVLSLRQDDKAAKQTEEENIEPAL